MAIWSTLLNITSLSLYTFFIRFAKILYLCFFQVTLTLLVFLLTPTPSRKKRLSLPGPNQERFLEIVGVFLFCFVFDLAEGLIAV